MPTLRRSPVSRARRGFALVAAGTTTLATVLVGLSASEANASSHREAPLIASDPAVDNTDVYAFVSPDRPDTVTLLANWIPFEEPNGGPNFYPFATDAGYNIHIDNDGDAKADLTYRWEFHTADRRDHTTFLYNNGPVTSLNDPNLLFRQTYTLKAIGDGWSRTLVRNAPVAPSFVGNASMPNYAALRSQAVTKLTGGLSSFAGQADDPFFLDLRVFDLLYGGDLSETGTDTLAGYNVNTIALQVPTAALALNTNPTRNPVIGVWSTTDRQSLQVADDKHVHLGSGVQVSRLGNPLVNEVIVPAGLKDRFNTTDPEQDRFMPQLLARVRDPEVPKLIQQIYGIKAPAAPRGDLEEIFLTGITTKAGGPIAADLNSQLNNADVPPQWFKPAEELRLNMSIRPNATPNRLGVLANDLQGFPNGRRLTDDVVDIELQALEGAAQTGKIVAPLAAGDRVDSNDNTFGKSFPYVALPNSEVSPGGLSKLNRSGSGGAASNNAPAAAAGDSASDNGVMTKENMPMMLGAGIAGVGLLGTGAWLLRRRRPGTGPATRN